MKIKVELDCSIAEEEIIIRCRGLTEEVTTIQRVLADLAVKEKQLVLYKGETEYYLDLEGILFFETDQKGLCAHTIDDVYQIKYRLYELEEFLPGHFMRISKSAILNIDKVYSITRNLTASSVVEFQNTHKQVYVSRYYYKPLKNKLEEKRKIR
jgi:DNA-binding LytR/AlgR family response regulator